MSRRTTQGSRYAGECVHRFGDFSPVAFGQHEGLVEAATCKKCGREKRRRAK